MTEQQRQAQQTTMVENVKLVLRDANDKNHGNSDVDLSITGSCSSSSSSSSDSVDTHQALMDMLNLSCEDDDLTTHQDEDEGEQIVVPIKQIQRHDVHLPPRCSRYLRSDCVAFYVDGLVSSQQCQDVLQEAASHGFRYITEATHTALDGSKYTVEIQNPNPHQLSVFENQTLVNSLWQSLERHVVGLELGGSNRGVACGLNPKLRVLKYNAKHKDRFEPHFDATTTMDGTTSLLTVLLYLNDGNGADFEGGETHYLNHHVSKQENDNGAAATVLVPKTGRVVVFEHDLYHASVPLTWGTKYVLRTDVMFAQKETTTVHPKEEEESSDDKYEDTNKNAPCCCLLVRDLVQQVNLTAQQIRVLEDMDVLEMTLESFLAPSLLKTMLVDGGISETIADDLIHAARKAVQSQE